MRISTRGRYGVRLMLDLALHEGQGPVFLKDISRRQEISQKYLWQLMDPLMKSGLVVSTRGAKGGYALAKPSEKISLKDIVFLLEGPMDLVKCVYNPSVCRRASVCTVRDVWRQMSKNILSSLQACTLKDMVRNQKNKMKKSKR